MISPRLAYAQNRRYVRRGHMIEHLLYSIIHSSLNNLNWDEFNRHAVVYVSMSTIQMSNVGAVWPAAVILAAGGH